MTKQVSQRFLARRHWKEDREVEASRINGRPSKKDGMDQKNEDRC